MFQHVLKKDLELKIVQLSDFVVQWHDEQRKETKYSLTKYFSSNAL